MSNAEFRWGAYRRALNRFIHLRYIRKQEGYDTMALVTLTLEVRVDFDDPEKHIALREAAKSAARDMISMACLLQERIVPEVSLYENTNEGSELIEILEDA